VIRLAFLVVLAFALFQLGPIGCGRMAPLERPASLGDP